MKRASWHQRETAATHVYLLRRADGLLKVGISKNVQRRLNGLRTATPDKLDLRCSLFIGKEMAFATESGFKILMSPCHVRGEWFNCADVEAIIALHAIQQGDVVGCNLARETIIWEQKKKGKIVWDLAPDEQIDYRQHRNKFYAYAADILNKFPQSFEHAPFARALIILNNSPQRPLEAIDDDPPHTAHAKWLRLNDLQIKRARQAARLAEQRAASPK